MYACPPKATQGSTMAVNSAVLNRTQRLEVKPHVWPLFPILPPIRPPGLLDLHGRWGCSLLAPLCHHVRSRGQNSSFGVSACCFCSVAQSCPTLQPTKTAACQASLSFTISMSLIKLMSVELMMPPSVAPFSCLQSFPASRSFPVSQLFASGGHNIGASASILVLPMNSQG